MPKQTRGFWVCNFCGLSCDRYDEANYHELEECTVRRSTSTVQTLPIAARATTHPDLPPPPNLPSAAAAAAAPPTATTSSATTTTTYWQHYPRPYAAASSTTTMAPLNLVEHQHLPPDYDTMYDYDPRYVPVAHASSTPASRRRLPLMSPSESSSLAESDTIACRSIEVFEIGESDMDYSKPQHQQPLGQAALRCTFCAGKMAADSHNCEVPRSIAFVCDNVRRLADLHLSRCSAVPGALRRVLEHAASKRKSRRNPDIDDDDDERSRKLLQDFCVSRCQQMGLVNKYPENSGIFFHEYGAVSMSGPSRGMLPEMGPGPPPMGRSSRVEQSAPPPRDDPFYHPPTMGQGHRPVDPYAHGYDAPYLPGLQHREPPPPPPPSDIAPGVSPQYDRMDNAPSHYHHPLPIYNMPSNFPYYQEPNGDWLCKFCIQIPPPYRDHNYFWSSPNGAPPPPHFVDYHLSICREYARGGYHHPHQPPDYAAPPPGYGYPAGSATPPPPPYSHSSGWDGPTGTPRHFAAIASDLSPQSAHETVEPLPERSMGSYGDRHSSQSSAVVPLKEPAERDSETRQAIEYLVANDKSMHDAEGRPLSEDARLVLDEDKLLLTDYFFFLMKQLRLVRFSEADRRTRGGKREKIQLGYGGLQCVHCADAPNARKFFWSNVDRLANSFAEIPGHVLKCRRCQKPFKDALVLLKQLHAEQMARLPRGSQKVFFRRMWRRLHDEDPHQLSEVTSDEVTPPKSPNMSLSSGQAAVPPGDRKPAAIDTKPSSTDDSPDGTSGSDESFLVYERPTSVAAKALADSVRPAASPARRSPPSPSSRILLAIPEDKEWLSDTDCFIRRQIEVFCATVEDVEVARADRKYPVHQGQIGIRCIHCAISKTGEGAKGQGVAYPFAISGIYESVREFQRLHLDSCENLPPTISSKLAALKGSSSLSSVLRKYYILAAKALGLHDTRDGIHAGGPSVPLGSQAAFAFSDRKSHLTHEMKQPSPGGEVMQDILGSGGGGGGSNRSVVDRPTMRYSPTGTESNPKKRQGAHAGGESPDSKKSSRSSKSRSDGTTKSESV